MINCEHIIVQCVGSLFFSSGILTSDDNDDDEQTIPLIKYLLSVFIPLVYFLSCTDVFPPLQYPPYEDLQYR